MEEGAGGPLIEPFITYPATQIADVALILVAAIICLGIIALWSVMVPDKPKRRK